MTLQVILSEIFWQFSIDIVINIYDKGQLLMEAN